MAVLALVFANIIGGGAALASKILLRELPPLTILFLRLTIMLMVLIPFSYTSFRHLLTHRKKLTFLGLFWVGNLSMYIIGIKYTTAIAASVIYLGIPILVIAEDYILNKSTLLWWQVAGIILGGIGGLIILFESIGTSLGFGTFQGNMLLVFAIVSFSFYLTYSKRLSYHISPLGLTVGSTCVGWIVSLIVMLIFDGSSGIAHLPYLSSGSWMALLYIGLLLGVVMYILNQWGIKHGSAVVAGTMLYVGTLTAWVTGVLFLSEKITALILLGGALLVLGVFLSSVMPYIAYRRH